MTSSLEQMLQSLEALEITHVVGIPDNTSGPLFDGLADAAGSRPRLVTVSREGEGIALASGLWLGGARPLMVLQSTGLLESGDALRGTAVRMGAALPLLVTGRGYAKLERAGLDPGEPLTPGLLTRPDVDSAALLAERTLSAWGIPYRRVAGPAAGGALPEVVAQARAESRPVALLVTSGLT